MAVAIVPNARHLSTGHWHFSCVQSLHRYQDMPGWGLIRCYTRRSPTMTICAGYGDALHRHFELITSITILPGQGVGGVGAGCSIVSLAEIAASYPGDPAMDIPQMLMQGGFLEPPMVYGTVFDPQHQRCP